jgi:hypothetical protein
MYPKRCLCCGGAVLEYDRGDSIPDLTLGPGDAWCPGCRWVLLREALTEPGWYLPCPTHGEWVSGMPLLR